MNTFGRAFRVTTFGESHGAGLGAVVDGCPAGLKLGEADVQQELDRRRPGQSALTTARSERDQAEILSGVFEGKTTGAPIAILVRNEDADPSAYEAIRDLPRPGHADYVYQAKYGHRDYRGGGRAAGRETLGRVAAGAIAKKLIGQHGIGVYAHTIAIGAVTAGPATMDDIVANPCKNPVRTADLSSVAAMSEAIGKARSEGDSIGGAVEIVATGLPVGLGSPVFGKLDADVAGALMGIGGVKAVEIGAGTRSALLKGSEMNDEPVLEGGQVRARTNHCGGILGGISNGMPLVCRISVKPTPSIAKQQRTVDIARMEEAVIAIKGRHDPSIVPRVVPVAEAMVALVIADHMIMAGKICPDRI